VREVVVAAADTDSVNGVELLAAFLRSPPYEADKLWLPDARVEVVKVAIPPLRAIVPRAVEPSWNVTLPVAEAGLTVAVSVTGWPNGAGEGDTESVVVVVERATDSVARLEVLDAFLESPP
jgi:hypothetical protein